ncbi:MAG: pantoate--beta-alanine ligase [Edaphocola sp.]
MFIFKKITDLKPWVDQQKQLGFSIGFVPTMGALHQGHLSLVAESKKGSGLTVASIFVNPTQFNDLADLEKYPRTTEQDIKLLSGAGCDVLFLPDVAEMYPGNLKLDKAYDLGYVETVLDGASRPGHFQGVAQVVEKLLDIVQPDELYMGQKDFQQIAVIKRLLSLKKSNIVLVPVPTKREPDGLAMSSRNTRLSEAQRNTANLLYQCLVSIQAKKDIQSFGVIRKECWDLLENKGVQPDYITLADAATLEILSDFDQSRNMVALMAAFVGEVRLIDNLIL